MKRKTQAIIWVIVFGLITISPFFTFYYFDSFIFIISPFSLFIMIKMIKGISNGEYEEDPLNKHLPTIKRPK